MTSDEIDFWERVYLAVIQRKGRDAAWHADEAVIARRKRTQEDPI